MYSGSGRGGPSQQVLQQQPHQTPKQNPQQQGGQAQQNTGQQSSAFMFPGFPMPQLLEQMSAASTRNAATGATQFNPLAAAAAALATNSAAAAQSQQPAGGFGAAASAGGFGRQASYDARNPFESDSSYWSSLFPGLGTRAPYPGASFAGLQQPQPQPQQPQPQQHPKGTEQQFGSAHQHNRGGETYGAQQKSGSARGGSMRSAMGGNVSNATAAPQPQQHQQRANKSAATAGASSATGFPDLFSSAFPAFFSQLMNSNMPSGSGGASNYPFPFGPFANPSGVNNAIAPNNAGSTAAAASANSGSGSNSNAPNYFSQFPFANLFDSSQQQQQQQPLRNGFTGQSVSADPFGIASGSRKAGTNEDPYASVGRAGNKASMPGSTLKGSSSKQQQYSQQPSFPGSGWGAGSAAATDPLMAAFGVAGSYAGAAGAGGMAGFTGAAGGSGWPQRHSGAEPTGFGAESASGAGAMRHGSSGGGGSMGMGMAGVGMNRAAAGAAAADPMAAALLASSFGQASAQRPPNVLEQMQALMSAFGHPAAAAASRYRPF